MEVVLLERIEKLGKMGDVVTVKPGFARNFLLPQSKALRATKANLAAFEAQKAVLEAQNLKAKEDAQAVAVKVDGYKVAVIRQAGDMGQLYGSVNARDIAAGITAGGFKVSRQQIKLSTPIKTIGLHEVTLQLHPEVSVSVIVNVARSEDEAAIQAETGHAMKTMEDDFEVEDDYVADEAEVEASVAEETAE